MITTSRVGWGKECGMTKHEVVGAISELWRFPVKSMQGEALVAAQVLAEHGIHGDRGYAVQDR